jgi:cysteine-rich repeat protein
MRATLLVSLPAGVAAGCGGGDTPPAPCTGPECAVPDGGDPDLWMMGMERDGSTGAVCGDGRVSRGEICDDGNTTDGDGCSADCTSDETCGNGFVDTAAGERCDDGNTADGDGCSADCRSDYSCGNGVRDDSVGEECDDGNTANGDGCDAACRAEVCGNGVIDFGEVCDDGNTMDGDLCSADCTASNLCGNGDLDPGEECDPPGATCSADCRNVVCGNGRVDGTEACDDGNGDDTDGCRADCTFTCTSDTDCSNGAVCDGDEVCTSPSTVDSRCRPGTPPVPGTTCGSGLICSAMGACVAVACGDGIVSGTEQCDDGNLDQTDGCRTDCTFTCTTANAATNCDDGNECTTDACTGTGTASRCTHTVRTGTCTLPGGGTGTCNATGACVTSASCGNGRREGSEQCDDGNTNDNDGCRRDCTFTCTTANAATNCNDMNPCTMDTCTGTGTASRCTNTAVPNGRSCGGSNICNMGVCVAARCGDGIRTGSEECDDGNASNDDGCRTDCTFTCTAATTATHCDDGNVCNGTETCTNPGTLMSRCAAGTPPPDGTACDADMMPATRDICRMRACRRSLCGDGYVDMGATPPEQCDDGNTSNGDGCSATCTRESMTIPPTGFRVNSLRLISPRIVVNVPLGGCQDITDNCARVLASCVADSINTQIANSLRPMSAGGTYSLHVVNVFNPLSPASMTSPLDIHLNAACMEAPTPDACSPDMMMPDVVMTTANNLSSGTCYTPVASEVNGRRGTSTVTYTPTANTVSAPCYVTDEATLTVTVSGISIPLRRARVSATYNPGASPTTLASGVVTGFLTSEDAARIRLPTTLPAPLGGAPLYTVLQTGGAPVMVDGMTVNGGCNVGGGVAEDDRDTLPDGTRGFWFFLNFTGERITWTP